MLLSKLPPELNRMMENATEVLRVASHLPHVLFRSPDRHSKSYRIALATGGTGFNMAVIPGEWLNTLNTIAAHVADIENKRLGREPRTSVPPPPKVRRDTFDTQTTNTTLIRLNSLEAS